MAIRHASISVTHKSVRVICAYFIMLLLIYICLTECNEAQMDAINQPVLIATIVITFLDLS